jgi:uncharacterized protein YjiS (DUF1127 family)
MTVLTKTFFAGTSITARFTALREQYREAAAKRKKYHQILTELGNLSARDLADLGMSPSSTQEIAYRAAYGEL